MLKWSGIATSELICSLENLDENGNLVSKADIFTKRTIVPYVAPTHADTVSDALTISIAEKARVDLDYMSKLCGKDKDTILSEMKGVIFESPVNGKYETADEYLSGDVREKLRLAEVMAKNNDKYVINVEALREVQPEELKPSEISIQLCSTWIPVKYYEQFMYETFDTPYYNTFITSGLPFGYFDIVKITNSQYTPKQASHSQFTGCVPQTPMFSCGKILLKNHFYYIASMDISNQKRHSVECHF